MRRTIIATAILLMDSIGSGNFRAQAQRDQLIYEDRLNALSTERDHRAEEAAAAQERFSSALEAISAMQSELLASEDRRRELETGIEVIQATLRRTLEERNKVTARMESLESAAAQGTAVSGTSNGGELSDTVDILAEALAQTAAERDQIEADAVDLVAGDVGKLRQGDRVADQLDAVVRLVPGGYLANLALLELPRAQRLAAPQIEAVVGDQRIAGVVAGK